jgi:thioredoxin-like negative regulator of GroEL
MDIKITTFLFSKYSNNCKAFAEILSKIPNEYRNNLKLTDICIDNENIRKNILTSKKIDIKMVPCILMVYNNGAIEKFEGIDAFNWINEIIGNLLKSQENETQLKQQQDIHNQLQQQISSQQQQIIEQQQLLEQQKVSSIPAKKQVILPNKTTINKTSGLNSKIGEQRIIKKTPAVTIVAAWIKADTGVGPSIASGNQV